MAGDTGCCGYDFGEKRPNLFGLITFSAPMIILGGVAFSILLIASLVIPSLKKGKDRIFIVIKANLYLVHAASFHPKLRCKLAGRIFPYLPRLSGMVYRNFNLTLLVLAWMGLVILTLIIFS